MKWKQEEINKAIELIKLGKSYTEIGLNINRNRKSVKEKLNYLGYFFKNYKKSTIIFKNCVNCDVSFSSLISENRKFCSSSCSATHNNRFNIKHTNLVLTPLNLRNDKKENYSIICFYCKNESHNRQINSKYCSRDCHFKHRKQILKDKIESGDLTQTSKQYKNYLIELHGEKCMDCGWCQINPISNKIPIELEHIDGNSENNKLDNLKLLCPNCHSLTPTDRALNIGNGRHSRRERYKQGKSY